MTPASLAPSFLPPSQPLLVHSAAPWKADAPTWALVREGRILASGSGRSWEAELQPGVRIEDARGRTLAPGFVDMHCHGGGGASFEDPESADTILQTHARSGTAVVTASLVSNPQDSLIRSIRAIKAAADRGLPLSGIHLEGPCLSPAHKGAHAENFLRAPSVRTLEPLLEAAGGLIRQVTLAPELDPGLETTRFLIENSVAVAVGHTDADYSAARAAFDAGASILTHAFNAMNGLHHRSPGPIAAAIDSSHVTLEAIADGVHIHAPMLRLLFSAAPGRVALITDAMAAAGCGDGSYSLGALDVSVVDGVARLTDGGAIAGSTLTMSRAVNVAVDAGIPLSEAVAAATETPARALGLPENKRFASAGTLLPGAPAPTLLAVPADGARPVS